MPFRDVAAIVLAACVLAACGSSPKYIPKPTPPLPTPTPVGAETPAAGSIYLGGYVNVPNGNATITTVESAIGRPFALNVHYESWTEKFPSSPEDNDLSYGRLPIDSWNCGPTDAQIANGSADLLIETRALAIKTYGHPIFLRYLWDMNGPASIFTRGGCYDASTDNANGTFSATEYVAAWQHIRAIFASKGVTNVVWVWCPNAQYGDPTAYYPGSSQVDWVGVDAYDPTGAGFAATFSSIYPILAKFNKPILVAEAGEPAAGQPAYFDAAAATLQSQFPQIKGFVYYDSVDTNGSNAGTDWTLSPSGLAELAAFAKTSYAGARGSL